MLWYYKFILFTIILSYTMKTLILILEEYHKILLIIYFINTIHFCHNILYWKNMLLACHQPEQSNTLSGQLWALGCSTSYSCRDRLRCVTVFFFPGYQMYWYKTKKMSIYIRAIYRKIFKKHLLDRFCS